MTLHNVILRKIWIFCVIVNRNLLNMNFVMLSFSYNCMYIVQIQFAHSVYGGNGKIHIFIPLCNIGKSIFFLMNRPYDSYMLLGHLYWSILRSHISKIKHTSFLSSFVIYFTSTFCVMCLEYGNPFFSSITNYPFNN